MLSPEENKKDTQIGRKTLQPKQEWYFTPFWVQSKKFMAAQRSEAYGILPNNFMTPSESSIMRIIPRTGGQDT